MSFMNPDRLWWLAVPVAIALLYLVLAARRRATSGGSTNSILRRVLPRDAALKRHLSVLASVLSLASLVVAYARPQAMTQAPRERATIVVTIDVSRSMEAPDVPRTGSMPPSRGPRTSWIRCPRPSTWRW